ncbi:MAG TPA: response regulator [Vicinamibacterales bacterium]|nr:response regulator [Vicinamibacterales bacterium]
MLTFRALVVEDHKGVRSFVERVLRDAGYDTRVAADGVAARDIVLQSGPPDIVVTDESMPRMSGHEFARWLRRRWPDVKILFLSGYSDPIYGDRNGLWDNEGYLEKPCTVRGLLQAVSRLLCRRLDPPAALRQQRSL